MQIERLILSNFKGISEDEHLARLNIFIGPNGSGKTARMIAPGYAITGRTPAGAKPNDVMKLASAPTCGVTVQLDDGFTWSRTATADPTTGRVTTEIAVTPDTRFGMSPGSGKQALEAAVWSHVGNFAPTFDVGAFLGLSPDKRRDLVLTLCATAKAQGEPWLAKPMTTAMSIGYCRQALGEATAQAHMDGFVRHFAGEAPAKDEEALLEFVVGKLGEAERLSLALITDEVFQAIGTIAAEDEIGRIAHALQTARNIANRSKGFANESIAAARKLNERKAEINVSAASIPELDAELKTHTERRETLIQSIGAAQGRASAKDAFDARIESDKTQAEVATNAIRKFEGFDREAADKKLELLIGDKGRAEERMRELGSSEAGPTESAVQEARMTLQNEGLKLQGITVRWESIAREAGGLRSQIKAFDEAPAEQIWTLLGAAGKVVKRPTKAGNEAWTALVDYVGALRKPKTRELLVGHIEALESKLSDREDEEKAGEVAVEQAQAALDGIVAERGAVAKRAYDSRDAINDAMKNATEASVAAVKIERELQQNQTAKEAAVSDLNAAERDRAEAEAGLARLLDAEVEGADPVSVEEGQAMSDALLKHIDGIKAQVEAKRTYQAVERELAVCIENAERTKALRDAATKYADAIRVIREDRIHRATTPLMHLMETFLSVAKPNHRPTLDLDDKGFTLGWVDSRVGRTIPLDALSAGETAIYCAALLYALVALADPPLKLLVIEIGEVDVVNMMALLDAFEATPEEFQVMIAHHGPVAYSGEAWTTRNLHLPKQSPALATEDEEAAVAELAGEEVAR